MPGQQYDQYGIPIPPKKGTKGSKFEKGFWEKGYNQGVSGFSDTRKMFWNMFGKEKGEKYLGAKQDEIAKGMKTGKMAVLVILAIGFLL